MMTPVFHPLLSDVASIKTRVSARAPKGTFSAARVTRHSPVGAWATNPLSELPLQMHALRLPQGVASAPHTADMRHHASLASE
jgi:hypothetical protein